MSVPAANLGYERAVLGLLLLGLDRMPARVFVDGHLRPDHLYGQRHRLILDAMIALHDAGTGIDENTVRSALRAAGTWEQVGQGVLDECAAHAGMPGSVVHYCDELRALAAWRARAAAARNLLAACDATDTDAVDSALTALAAADAGRGDSHAYDPQQATDAVLRHVQGHTLKARWRWPLPRLNRLTLGGLRPGQVTFVSGPTRHGKSVFLDQILESCVADGAKASLYLNEMDRDERAMRCAARGSQVPHPHLVAAEMSDRDNQRLVQWGAEGGVRFRMQECDGWSAQDVARDARHRRLDVVAFDLLDELPLLSGMTRRETAEESMRVFKQLALGAHCHVLVVGHLNRNRSSASATIPVPSLGDIRESGMLANRAHNVVFVWREQDRDTGDPTDEGVIRVAKVRQGTPGGVAVIFDGDRQRFLEDASQLRGVAA